MTATQGGRASAWTPELLAALETFKQGHLLEGVPFLYWGPVKKPLPWTPVTGGEGQDGEEGRELQDVRDDDAREDEARSSEESFDVLEYDPLGGATCHGIITSQTCDIAEVGEPEQPTVQVSPAYRVGATPSTGQLPQYLFRIEPPDLPEGDWVADLRIEVAVEKTYLLGRKPIEAFSAEDGYLALGAALGRRRDRAALAADLVDRVAGSLRKLRNNKRFKKVLHDEVHSVRLAVTGDRLKPRTVAVHVLTHGEVTPNARGRFENWWRTARDDLKAVDIDLLPNQYHDCGAMDISLYESLINLGIKSSA